MGQPRRAGGALPRLCRQSDAGRAGEAERDRAAHQGRDHPRHPAQRRADPRADRAAPARIAAAPQHDAHRPAQRRRVRSAAGVGLPPMVPAQVLSRILAVQPVLDALERDQAAPRTAFEHLAIGQAVTGLVKSQVKDISLVLIDGHTVAMRLPRRVETGDTLKLSFAGHMPQPVFLLETPETAASDAPQLSQTARLLSDIMQRVPDRTLPTLTPPAPLL